MIPIPREDLVIMMESGYIYLRMGRFVEAKEVFEGVAVLAPENEVPWVALGSVHFAQLKFDQALRAYKKAIVMKPNSAFARAYFGETLFFKGKKEEAFEELNKASLLDPEGKSGDFARSLLDAIKQGFVPPPQTVSH